MRKQWRFIYEMNLKLTNLLCLYFVMNCIPKNRKLLYKRLIVEYYLDKWNNFYLFLQVFGQTFSCWRQLKYI